MTVQPDPVTAPDLPDMLVSYLTVRNRQRAEAVARTLTAMTEREQRLVREAAVMGYVRGALFGQAHNRNAGLPDDSAIVADVITACHSNADLYPVINSLENPS